MITVSINGSHRELPDGLTVEGLIQEFHLKPNSVVVEHNHQVVHRNAYPSTPVSDRDTIEIVRVVGGG